MIDKDDISLHQCMLNASNAKDEKQKRVRRVCWLELNTNYRFKYASVKFSKILFIINKSTSKQTYFIYEQNNSVVE
jgi:hypothetical protein